MRHAPEVRQHRTDPAKCVTYLPFGQEAMQ